MVDEADRDGDNAINEEEFMRIMRKTNLFWALESSVSPISSSNRLRDYFFLRQRPQ